MAGLDTKRSDIEEAALAVTPQSHHSSAKGGRMIVL